MYCDNFFEGCEGFSKYMNIFTFLCKNMCINMWKNIHMYE